MPAQPLPESTPSRAAAPPSRASDDPVMQELWRVKDERAERFVDARALARHLRARYPGPSPKQP